MFGFKSKKRKDINKEPKEKFYLGAEGLRQIDNMVNNITGQTIEMFQGASKEQIEVFKQELRKDSISYYKEALKDGRESGFGHASATDPYNKNEYASCQKQLVSAGIVKEGEHNIPGTYYTSTVDKVINEPMDEKQIEDLNQNLDGVCNWIKENPNTDPNCYEMSNLFISTSKLCGNMPNKLNKNLDFLGDKRLKDLKDRLGVNEDDSLYKLQSKLFESAKSGEPVTYDKKAQEYISKCSSVSLYIKQQQKENPEFKFTNTAELEEMMAMKTYCEKQEVIIPSECDNLFKGIYREYEVEKEQDSFRVNLSSQTEPNPKNNISKSNDMPEKDIER